MKNKSSKAWKGIVSALLLAALSSHAERVDFEQPTYSAGNVGGQDGWVVSSGTANVAANGNLSGLQELGVDASGTAYRNFAGGNFAEDTTFSFEVGHASGLNGYVRLGIGESTDNAIIYLYFSYSGKIYADEGSGLVEVWDQFDANKVYKISCDIDFGTQAYDLTIENRTDGESTSVLAVGFYSGRTLSQFKSSGGTVRVDSAFNTLYMDDISIAPTPSVWPSFYEGFENNATNAGTLGALNGQHGWMAGAGAVVQDSVAQSGSQALQLQNAAASQLFDDTASLTNVQITFNVWVRADDGVPNLPEKAAALFYVDSSQHLVVYSNTVPVELATVVETNRWTEFKVTCNYAAQTWALRVDGVAVADGLPFYSPQATFSELTVTDDGSAPNPTYVDGITVAQQIFTEDDTDGDGLPDAWEIFYYGGIWINPSALCADGIHAVWEAYVAGFDPTDPSACFGIAGFLPDSGSGHVLQWDETPGRVYTIYWSSNLSSGFTVLQADYVGSAFTDTLHNACSEGFYRLDVEVAP